MKDELLAAQLMDTLYMMIAANLDDKICNACPVVRAVRDLRDTVKDASSDKIITQLGISFPKMKCPCDRS